MAASSKPQAPTIDADPALESRDASARAAAFVKAHADVSRGAERERARLEGLIGAVGAKAISDDAELAARERRVLIRFDGEIAASLRDELDPLVAERRAQPQRSQVPKIFATILAHAVRTKTETGADLNPWPLATAYARSEVARRPHTLAALASSMACLTEPAGTARTSVLAAAETLMRCAFADDITAGEKALDELESTTIAVANSRILNPDAAHLDWCARRLERWSSAATLYGVGEWERFEREIEAERQATARAENEARRLMITRFRRGEGDTLPEGMTEDNARLLPATTFGELVRDGVRRVAGMLGRSE